MNTILTIIIIISITQGDVTEVAASSEMATMNDCVFAMGGTAQEYYREGLVGTITQKLMQTNSGYILAFDTPQQEGEELVSVTIECVQINTQTLFRSSDGF
jgi:hypothetical protein